MAKPAGYFRLLAHHPLPIRLAALYVGLFLYGFSAGLMLRSTLGNMPWDVLHEGLSKLTGISIGLIVVILSFLLLLLWIPLKQRPGLGTLSNALLVGLFIDLTLFIVPAPEQLWLRIVFVALAILINAVATVLYIIPNFGPGPRDGLMTGLVLKTGGSVTVVRASIEITVMLIGWLLGGTLFIATIVFAVVIGPVTHYILHLAIKLFGPGDPMVSEDT
ncbi:hypothetical protein EW640_10800 [Brevibacterium luteolum]|uniref:YitT family protein n=1 Tax=Brevibacterium luteolum TaxID=199591 RepID=A0A6G8KYY0_9MICO|nr:hypothetical protein EW640_10800 [Brevibacterium luteolum]